MAYTTGLVRGVLAINKILSDSNKSHTDVKQNTNNITSDLEKYQKWLNFNPKVDTGFS